MPLVSKPKNIYCGWKKSMPKKDSYFPFDEKEISWLCHRDSQLKAVISHMEKPKRKLLPDLFSGLIFYIIHNRFRQKLPKQNGHVSKNYFHRSYQKIFAVLVRKKYRRQVQHFDESDISNALPNNGKRWMWNL